MTAFPGCNQCGDGFNAPADCDRGPVASARCRARLREQIETSYVRWIAELPTDRARGAWFGRMVERKRDPARIAELRRKVFALMVAEGRAVVPPRGEADELEQAL